MQTTTSPTVQIVPTNERAARIARLTATAQAAGWAVTPAQIVAAVDAATWLETNGSGPAPLAVIGKEPSGVYLTNEPVFPVRKPHAAWRDLTVTLSAAGYDRLADRIASVDELRPGDRVYSLLTGRYGEVLRTHKVSARLRFDDGREWRANVAGLAWLHYNELQIAAAAGQPIAPREEE